MELRKGILSQPEALDKWPIVSVYFIICAKYLGRYLHFMSNILELGIGIQPAKEAPKIPYLMFARFCNLY